MYDNWQTSITLLTFIHVKHMNPDIFCTKTLYVCKNIPKFAPITKIKPTKNE